MSRACAKMAGRALVLLIACGAASPASAAPDGLGADSATTTASSTPEGDPSPRCSWSCMHRKQIERDTIESIKEYILEKLGMSEPPRIPPHLRFNPSAIDVLLNRTLSGPAGGGGWASDDGMQSDQPAAGSLDDALLQMRDCDDDVKPRKVIAFAETGSNHSKQCLRYEGNQIHFFRFSKEVMGYKVVSAKLWVYLHAPTYLNSSLLHNVTAGAQHARPHAAGPQQFAFQPPRGATGAPPSSLHYFARSPPGAATSHQHRHQHRHGASETVILTVVWAKHLTDGTLYLSFLTSLKFQVPANKGKWVHVDLTKTIADWFKKPDSELGLVLSATDVNGKEVKVSSGDDRNGLQTPFIELTPSLASKPSRARRSLGIDCDGTTEEKRCCRYPLTVDFEKFEWDWIIAPKTYEANYCTGDCPYVFLQKYPHSYIVQVTNRTICCAPRKMSSISMLYFNTEHNILHSTLPGMTVEKCGCF